MPWTTRLTIAASSLALGCKCGPPVEGACAATFATAKSAKMAIRTKGVTARCMIFFQAIILAVRSNENMLSCCERGRARPRVKSWNSSKTKSYAGAQSAPERLGVGCCKQRKRRSKGAAERRRGCIERMEPELLSAREKEQMRCRRSRGSSSSCVSEDTSRGNQFSMRINIWPVGSGRGPRSLCRRNVVLSRSRWSCSADRSGTGRGDSFFVISSRPSYLLKAVAI